METEVIYQNGFQEQYFLADSKGKIEIILANFISFQHQLSGIEDGIKLDIKVDQDFKFRQDKGDLGIRVQTSGKSDPTAREAIRNVELDRAFDENDIERELEKTCTPDLFRNQLRMLSSMKDDYQVIKMVIVFFRDRFAYLIKSKRIVNVLKEKITGIARVADIFINKQG